MAKRTVVEKPKSFTWKELFQAALIIAAGLWIYLPAVHGDWLSDDRVYLVDNALMNDPARLWKAWFAPGSFVEYYPIQETVQWVQWDLWGSDTLGYHLTNIVLHLTGVLLLWRFLGKLGLRLAWLGALIFAVHPMNVESVAWISELKNTLSLPPFLLAMGAWIDYEEHRRNRDYWLALGLFLGAMLCKISMSPFPVVILIYAWWKRGKIGWPDAKAAAPFFLISLILGLITIRAGGQYMQTLLSESVYYPVGGFLSRIALAGTTLSFYFVRCFWPAMPLTMYPQWKVDPPSLLQFLPLLVVPGLFFWFWTRRQSWGRHVILGLSFFIFNLVPFLGLQNVSYMRYTWVMDHFLYLPMIGLIALVIAAMGQIDRQLSRVGRFCGAGAIAVIVLLMAIQSRTYAAAWQDESTLGNYILQHDPGAWPAHDDLGNDELARGHVVEALAHFKLAAQLNPNPFVGHNIMGAAYMRVGRFPEAIEEFQEAVKISGQNAEDYCCLGVALLQSGRAAEAVDPLRQAIRLNPKYALAYDELGSALVEQGKIAEGMTEINHALQLAPDFAQAHLDLGNALILSARIPEGIEEYERSLKIDPKQAANHYVLALALSKVGRIPEAIQHLQAALKIDPRYADAQKALDQLQAAPAKQ